MVLVITTGLFKDFIILFSIILIHEMGHIFGSIIFKWDFSKVTIYPFGGCTIFNTNVNRNLKEEFVILIFGPMFQIIYTIIIFILYKNNLIIYKTYDIFISYSIPILFFNMLPIYPLDGGRIVNILSNYLLPFKKGNRIVISISLMFLIIFCLNNLNYNKVVMISLIIFELFKYYKDQDNIYNKFLLERYLNNYSFKKYKLIKNEDMYKEKRNIIFYKNKYLTEKDYLSKRYGG